MPRKATATASLLSIADISRHFSLPESTTRYYCKRFAAYIPSVGEGRRRRYRHETLTVIAAILEQMQKSLPAMRWWWPRRSRRTRTPLQPLPPFPTQPCNFWNGKPPPWKPLLPCCACWWNACPHRLQARHRPPLTRCSASLRICAFYWNPLKRHSKPTWNSCGNGWGGRCATAMPTHHNHNKITMYYN